MGSSFEKDTARKSVGRQGEAIAAKFLEQKQFTVIERNFRKPWGEIDIIAVKGGCVHFVEVKTISREIATHDRNEVDQYVPEQQIDVRKLKKIARTAELYMSGTHDSRDFQLDAVGVILDVKHRKAICRLFEQILP